MLEVLLFTISSLPQQQLLGLQPNPTLVLSLLVSLSLIMLIVESAVWMSTVLQQLSTVNSKYLQATTSPLPLVALQLPEALSDI